MKWDRYRYDGWGVMAPAYTILPNRNVPTCGGKLEPTVMIRGGGYNTPCVHHCVPVAPLPLNHSWRPPSPPLQGVSRAFTNNNMVLNQSNGTVPSTSNSPRVQNNFTCDPPPPQSLCGAPPSPPLQGSLRAFTNNNMVLY